MSRQADAFWRFSLDLYARPQVAPACLELQDHHGLDVVLALYCCWLGASGRGRLDAAGLARAEATAAPWRGTLVQPVRTLRRSLKGIEGAEAIYSGIKRLELAAERAAHARLAALAPAADSRRVADERSADAAANLAFYVGEDVVDTAAPILAALPAVC